MLVSPALLALRHYQPDALLSLNVSSKSVPLVMVVTLSQLPVNSVSQVREQVLLMPVLVPLPPIVTLLVGRPLISVVPIQRAGMQLTVSPRHWSLIPLIVIVCNSLSAPPPNAKTAGTGIIGTPPSANFPLSC